MGDCHAPDIHNIHLSTHVHVHTHTQTHTHTHTRTNTKITPITWQAVVCPVRGVTMLHTPQHTHEHTNTHEHTLTHRNTHTRTHKSTQKHTHNSHPSPGRQWCVQYGALPCSTRPQDTGVQPGHFLASARRKSLGIINLQAPRLGTFCVCFVPKDAMPCDVTYLYIRISSMPFTTRCCIGHLCASAWQKS